MRFSRKIFLSVFLVTFVLGSALMWAAYAYVTMQAEERFEARYSVFTKILADTLNRMDLSTENLMLNAAKVIAEKDAHSGVLPESELVSLQNQLNVTHVFVTDSTGKFIRSTNETPDKIPNLFSFCGDYKNLITGKSNLEATPIIQPQPEPKPFKFLSIPNANRSRIIEVGVRVDFIAKTLAEAIASDKNVLSMSLYSPDGARFGKFTAKNVEFGGPKKVLPAKFDLLPESNENYAFYSKVLSSHPRCCQCDIAGTSKNGEYYYVLEADVSKDELKTLMATTKSAFIILAFGNILLAYAFSRLLSKRLVKNIEKAVKQVRHIKEHGDLSDRVALVGKDEVAFLTKEFDRLLETIESSQKKVIEAEKVQTKVQMAKDVAHNINSPIIAIEMMIPMMPRLPEWMQKSLKNSVKEIKTLSERLSKQADTLSGEPNGVGLPKDVIRLSQFLEDVIREKQIEFSNRPGVNIALTKGDLSYGDSILADSAELRAIISNIINNATQAYENGSGPVQVSISSNDHVVELAISDQGRGFNQDVLNKLGADIVTSGKKDGKGVGLFHAYKYVTAWGGKINIESAPNKGSRVILSFKHHFVMVRSETSTVVNQMSV